MAQICVLVGLLLKLHPAFLVQEAKYNFKKLSTRWNFREQKAAKHALAILHS
uniref:Uncharacterized protein n=1 Tax=Rhizophora mucronata TaxID=61149 RepID=A0A2P2NUY9_RHIMU